MENVVHHYAWGSTTMMAKIKNAPPSEQPEAEQWMGSHPRGQSILVDDDGGKKPIPLNSVPFLFKILTAEKGLSIQAHPSKVQAEEGFARENAAEIPIDAPHRNYRDANHKPELICAVTDFWGLRGFRPLTAIAFDLVSLCEIAPDLPQKFVSAVREFEENPIPERWRTVFLRLLEIGADRRVGNLLIEGAARLAGENSAADPREGRIDRNDRFWWVLELQRQFPGDPGTLAPLYLNLVHLSPGEAMYLDAQTLHAYLYGAGIEIMASSDNVLRSGCTEKHVDIDELARVLSFDGVLEPVIQPHRGAGVSRYATPAEEFELRRVVLREESQFRFIRKSGPVIVLAVGGTVVVSNGDNTVPIDSGASVFFGGLEEDGHRKRGAGKTGDPASTDEPFTISWSGGSEAPLEVYAFIASLPGGVDAAE